MKSAKEIFVKFKGGDRYKVEYFTYVDEDKDFSILKIAGFELPIIKLGNSDKVDEGENSAVTRESVDASEGKPEPVKTNGKKNEDVTRKN